MPPDHEPTERATVTEAEAIAAMPHQDDRYEIKRLREALETAQTERDQLRERLERRLELKMARLRQADEGVGVLETERDQAREALRRAADDLGKAANQFASLAAAGKPPQHNGEIFARKEAEARAALGPQAPEGGKDR